MPKLKWNQLARLNPVDVLSKAGVVLSGKHTGKMDVVGNDGRTYHPRLDSMRLRVFRRSRRCVCCGLWGTVIIMEYSGRCNGQPHFNLYGVVKGKLILMTKDHKVPRSKGGSEDMDNLQTCCTKCNSKKQNHEITIVEMRKRMANWIKLVKEEKKSRKKRIRKQRNVA